MVGREGGVGVEFSFDNGLMADGLTREGGFVDVERDGFEELTVGWHFLAGIEHHDIADYNVFSGDGGDIAVADHLHRFVVVYLIEQRELFVGLHLEEERQPGGQKDGYEYPYRLKEYACAFIEAPILIAGDAYRKRSGY